MPAHSMGQRAGAGDAEAENDQEDEEDEGDEEGGDDADDSLPLLAQYPREMTAGGETPQEKKRRATDGAQSAHWPRRWITPWLLTEARPQRLLSSLFRPYSHPCATGSTRLHMRRVARLNAGRGWMT